LKWRLPLSPSVRDFPDSGVTFECLSGGLPISCPIFPLLPSLSHNQGGVVTAAATPVNISHADLPLKVIGRCPCQRNLLHSDVEFQGVRPGLGANPISPGPSLSTLHPNQLAPGAASGSTVHQASITGIKVPTPLGRELPESSQTQSRRKPEGCCDVISMRHRTWHNEETRENVECKMIRSSTVPRHRSIRSSIPP
jgi:hypothetical protein